MFAGVGSFSIYMAKLGLAKRVFSIDINPTAVRLMRENARLNRVENRVSSIRGDAKDVITEHMQGIADRVVMPLPMKAYEYLDYAVMALKRSGGWIHYYDFEHASKTEDPVEKVKTKVEEKLRKLDVSFTISAGRVVRSVGPHWYQIALDILVSKKRALGRSCSYVV
jgi:tRNA (guanine37-N1)-methyltransferase